MKPFRKILVPVDFSEHSSEAVRVAADLARRYEATLTLAHVYEPTPPAVPDGFLFQMPGQLEKLEAEYAKLLLRTKAQAEAAGAARVETKHLRGVVASELTKFAAAQGFDLIVMGTHGRTGLQHALIGSVAERVVRHAPCPVLSVKPIESVN